jgi:hypothetical protein
MRMRGGEEAHERRFDPGPGHPHRLGRIQAPRLLAFGWLRHLTTILVQDGRKRNDLFMTTANRHLPETLQGQIERITYSNEENGYTIAKLKVYGRRDLVTVVGTRKALAIGIGNNKTEARYTRLGYRLREVSIDNFRNR